eukprot:10635946-Lingulodinium_polyedra.AAC.1
MMSFVCERAVSTSRSGPNRASACSRGAPGRPAFTLKRHCSFQRAGSSTSDGSAADSATRTP